MPAIKEAPYFCDDRRFSEGWTSFWREYFHDAGAGDLVGKVTPQYMGDLRVAARIAAEMPDVKIFCVLRNPIDRAFSDYRMRRRVGKEHRSFDEVVKIQSREDALHRARDYRHDRDQPMDVYLARSEYGRLLDRFRNEIGEERVQILFSENLKSSPEATVQRVLDHIGSRAPLETSALRKDFHVGGDHVRFKRLPDRLRNIPPLRALWHCIPPSVRKNIFVRYKYDWNVRKGHITMARETRSLLADFFRDDVKFLRESWDVTIPWNEFSDISM